MELQELATEALGWFERKERDDSDVFYRTKDDTPEWVRDMINAAHGDMMPDDWRYNMIHDTLSALDDGADGGDPHEWVDANISVYDADHDAWYSSHADRRGWYVDEAAKEMGRADTVDGEMIAGEYYERLEVWGLVVSALDDELLVR